MVISSFIGDCFRCGGSRGFTIYDKTGTVMYTSGNTMEEMTIRYGHYPDGRSENKGNEPENVLYAQYGSFKLLFVGSERSSLVFVFNRVLEELWWTQDRATLLLWFRFGLLSELRLIDDHRRAFF